MSFNEAFNEVIGFEGGYVNDPDDPGGETKYGISKRAFPTVDITNLTLEGARQIYLEHYWNKLQLSSVPHSAIAKEIFEQAVNMGKMQAVFHVQLAVKMLGQVVTLDGLMGPQTLGAIGRVRWDDLLKVLNGLQFIRYVDIVENNPSQKKFFRGWLKRVSL